MSFENPFGAPPDPKYLAFLAGLKKITEDEAQRRSWWWDHGAGEWYSWKATDWVLESIDGWADTSPGSALKDTFSLSGTPDWDLQQLWMPDLYKRVSVAFEAIKRKSPNVRPVWGPWNGGDWRAAWPRPKAPERGAGGTGPGDSRDDYPRV